MENSISKNEFHELFNNRENVFFIQIGANDGKTYDPIYDLVIKNNWSGILYEPGDNAYQELIKNYNNNNNNNLIFEKKAVSNYDGKGILFCGTTNMHFTLNYEKAKSMFDVEPKSLNVEIVSPKTIINQFNINKIDLLLIDVLGHEFEIIKAFPFEKIKPEIIRFEYVNMKVEYAIEYLESKGYVCYFDRIEGDIVAKLKRKIIVHNPCNEDTKYFKNYNLFWDKLTDVLKKKYIVNENRYFEFAHSGFFSIKLQKQQCDNFKLLECEYVIEFEDTGDFYIISASDLSSSSNIILAEKNNPNLKKVLISQFNRKEFELINANMEIYEPWIYFPATTLDLIQYYEKRKTLKNIINKMYFRGSGLEDRLFLNYINKDLLEGIWPIGGPETYFEDLINYKIGLSVAGRGEMCYRDIEYMALGIPFIRFEYSCELNPKLIPNFHYISVERPLDLQHDRMGNEKHAKMIEKRFLEVRNDEDFLKFISNNSKEYYDKYLSYDSNVYHTLNLLNI
jgi:FkbM family methyltransferase